MSKIGAREYELKNGARVTVRIPTMQDAMQMIEIMRAVVAEGPYTLTEPDEFDWTVMSKRQDISENLRHPGHLTLVAEVQGEVVGFLEFLNGQRRRTQHSGSLSIFIQDGFRENGIGSVLIGTLLGWARATPLIEKVTLAVFSTNTRAIAVYEKMGFLVEGRCPHDMKINAEYVDSVLMYQFVR
jgi:RimJ/RimL family protein N-acetyltransferase